MMINVPGVSVLRHIKLVSNREARGMSIFAFKTAEHAALYAKFRPAPPKELLERIASFAPSSETVLDVGCGSGQSTELLAGYFKQVVGSDVSEAQIAQAESRRDEKKLQNIEYKLSPADKMIFDNESFDVITASQCVHWFDLPKFYSEAHRVLRKGGLLAMFGYCIPIPTVGEPEIDENIKNRVMKLYRGDLGPYWETDRSLVDSRYETLPKPSSGLEPLHQDLEIVQQWPTDLNLYIQYLITWSSYQKFEKINPETDILGPLRTDLFKLCRRDTHQSADENCRIDIDTNFFLHIYKKEN